ncbi:MAG: helix-turn-helix transcriptional regulator [Mycobacteriales bacterium]
MAKTRLQELRESLGLTRTELAKRSDVSTRTIKRLEDPDDPGRDNVTDVMKFRVLNGLNEERQAKRRSEWSFAQVFPEASGAGDSHVA